jgi:endonuclease-8
MPEGDTILRIRHRLADALAGQALAVSAPSARGKATGVERLDGAVLERIETHGKHLMLACGDLVLHSHLGMSGSWQLYRHGERWRRSRNSAWVVLSGERHEAVQFGGPTQSLAHTCAGDRRRAANRAAVGA